jgi:hypothetical protein
MDIPNRVQELALEKYCCAQIVMAIGLEVLNKKNLDLLAAMRGLCLGTHVQKQCGTFSAAACMLSLFAGDKAPLLIAELALWFEEKFKSICCCDITSADDFNISKCSDLTAETCRFCFELLEEQGLMPDPE